MAVQPSAWVSHELEAKFVRPLADIFAMPGTSLSWVCVKCQGEGAMLSLMRATNNDRDNLREKGRAQHGTRTVVLQSDRARLIIVKWTNFVV